ncbi:MAG: B12-binding domain-containing radical SAM protein [Myxococcota bacterium]
MHVLFIQNNGLNESLALTETSACLREAGHTTAVLLERQERNLRRAIERENPDLLLIPSEILAHRWTLRTVGRIKGWFPDLPTVLAGSHPTMYPDILQFDDVEMILVGEIEEAAVALLDALAGKRSLDSVPNLHFKRGRTLHRNPVGSLVTDLDSLPLPDRGLYFDRYAFMRRFPWKKFTSGRGCVHHCTFCYQPSYRTMVRGRGRYVRRKSPERVVREVSAVAERYPTSNVHFSDDLFVTDRKWLTRFAEQFRSDVGLPYTMNTSPELLSEEAGRLLAESGCRAVAIGVETHDEALRKSILGKDISTETIRNAARIIRGNGMKLVTFNMVASPDERVEDVLETMRFNAELGTDFARVSICFPLPGTPIAKRPLADSSGVDPDDIYSLPDLEDARFDEVFFASAKPYESQFINLFHLFSLGASEPRLIPLIERAARLPKGPLYPVSSLVRMLKERALFHLSLLQGLDYFVHVGTPDKRTTNFVSLV